MPTSMADGSFCAGTPGMTESLQRLHGQVNCTVTVVLATGDWMLPALSIARLRMVTGPSGPAAFQVNVQVAVLVPACGVVTAFCHVVPSTDTSTPVTAPPTSAAVPVIVTGCPGRSVEPAVGAVIVDVGAAPPGVEARMPMSSKRFIVACCMSALGGVFPRSCVPSRPHDHCTVPAPKTSALLGARYNVRLCVAVPAP